MLRTRARLTNDGKTKWIGVGLWQQKRKWKKAHVRLSGKPLNGVEHRNLEHDLAQIREQLTLNQMDAYAKITKAKIGVKLW